MCCDLSSQREDNCCGRVISRFRGTSLDLLTPGDDTRAENLALKTEVKGLRELVDLYKERLTDADWRYYEMMEQFKAMTAALPAGKEKPTPAKRWWWPFR